MSRPALRALEAAERHATALGHGRLETVHLVLALLEEKGAAGAALARRGVTAEALAARADALYEGPRGGRARDLDRSGGEWREALELARDEADTAGANEIAPAHLFLAATADDSFLAVRALADLGIDVEAARRDVAALARDEAQGTL